MFAVEIAETLFLQSPSFRLDCVYIGTEAGDYPRQYGLPVILAGH
jgi:hypothetical protein